MVMPILSLEKENFPVELKKEIIVLKELGLEDYEIEYLVYLKTKKLASHKWRHQYPYQQHR